MAHDADDSMPVPMDVIRGYLKYIRVLVLLLDAVIFVFRVLRDPPV